MLRVQSPELACYCLTRQLSLYFINFSSESFILSSKEQGNEELSNKIIICNQKDCLHERFSFMKDLTSNTGGPRTDKKKPDKHDTHNGAHCDTIKEL